MEVYELVDFAVAVTGDVGNDSVARRAFRQAVNRHDREYLLDRPGVGQRLEDTEIRVVNIGKRRVQPLELVGYVFQPLHLFVHGNHDVPERIFRKSALAE